MSHEDPHHGPARPPPVVPPPFSPSQPAVASPSPTSHPMAMSTSVHGQSPPTPPSRRPPGFARPKPPVQPLEIPPRPISHHGSMSPHSQSMTYSPTPHRRPKPSVQPLEIPPIPVFQPGSMSPHSQSMSYSPTPHRQTLPSPGRQAEAVPPSPPSQPHMMARRPKPTFQPLEIPPSPGYQPEMMSPATRAASPTPQAAAMSPKLSPTSQRQSVSSTPHRQSFAMSPTSHTQMMVMSPSAHRQPLMMAPQHPHYQPYYPPPPYYHPGPPFNVAMAPTGGFQAPNHNYPDHERAWSTGLFDCTKDIKNCTRTLCCPCVTFGQIAEIVNEGTTPWYEPGLLCAVLAAFTPCFCIFHPSFPYTACYRNKLRKKYKLKGSTIEDCLVHSFCECCALCQEFRELDHQGFDVPLGWHENKRRERQAVAVFRFIPPEEQGMTR